MFILRQLQRLVGDSKPCFLCTLCIYAWEKNKRIHSARVTVVVGSVFFFFTFVVYMWKHTNNLLTCKEEKLRMKLQMKGSLPCSLYSTLRGYYFSKLLFFDGSGLQKTIKYPFSFLHFPIFFSFKVNFIYGSRAEVFGSDFNPLRAW